MLTVVGGTYLEFCREPYWSQMFGSGLRAAVACSALARKVRLHTYASERTESDLVAYAESFGVDLRTTRSSTTVEFRYSHPMATPVILPWPGEIPKQPEMLVNGRAVLRFGMLEGTARVVGGRVVFDPQNARSPEHFYANGSTAESLAVVLNNREAARLSGKQSPQKAARAIAKRGADIVIIKDGPRGAHVLASGHYFDIPSFQTDSVWPIGSGDVFAGLFAFFWAEQQVSVKEAAMRASWGTASFVSSRALPVRTKALKRVPTLRRAQRTPPKRGSVKVYLAGPFFTMAQRWLIAEARSALLGVGFNVFSPFHDVGIGPADQVVPVDLANLDDADVVFALVDGTDSGTLFEVGYARNAGTPVVVLAEHEGEQPLKMIDGSGCYVTADFSTAIYACWWAAAGDAAPLDFVES